MKSLCFRVITEPPHQIHWSMDDESWQPLLARMNLMKFWSRVVGHGAVVDHGVLSSRLVFIKILAEAETAEALYSAEHDVMMAFRSCGYTVEDIQDGWGHP